MTVDANGIGSLPSPQISFWDWQRESWESRALLSWGENRISAADRLLGPGKRVRVRLEHPGPASLGIDRLDIAYLGRLPAAGGGVR